ncbi:hypothetical protein IFM89_033766 [Coptis chinensis]|uniref:SAC domain-containing protein n=1 Tax=Coptis chinensis TaxID=261450 RepID=A0A835LXG8_9MAGN|nr:hypothetical protein IFM89_033766 [Coptis chinensis]
MSCAFQWTTKVFIIYGVVGTIRLLAASTAFLQKRDEAYFMSLLRTVESTLGLYYSYETDLTLNLMVCGFDVYQTCADPRFVWNRSLLEELIEFQVPLFITDAENMCFRFEGQFHFFGSKSWI